MSGALRVLLPPTAADLVPAVLAAGCTPVIDVTAGPVPTIDEGAWIRTRRGRPTPGTGPVILAEGQAPVEGRPTWLEVTEPGPIPEGFAGVVLRGREAGGRGGASDGLVALAACPEPGRVLLDAGAGPQTAAAAAALGAAGVVLADTHLACPELELPAGLARRLELPADELTRVVAGLRVCASPASPVVRRLLAGEDPWALAEELWATGDPSAHLWLAGQGLTLARPLAERHGSLAALLAAYRSAVQGWAAAIHATEPVAGSAHVVGTVDGLVGDGTAAGTGGVVGCTVLWQLAHWMGRPIVGDPLRAAAATGGRVVTDDAALATLQASVPAPAAAARAPTLAAPPPNAARSTHNAAIAIVGMGCRFPGGSNSVEQYWQNIVNGVYAISEVPASRWDPALFWDADHQTPDKTYCKIGGFLQGFRFDSKRFRIPPSVARQVDEVQQITLECVADALQDAGLRIDRRSEGKAFDRERTAVILGNSLGGEKSDEYAVRLAWPDVARRLVATPPFSAMPQAERSALLVQLEQAYKAGLPVVDQDSMPGELANVIAGRIANAFDLGGANFTVDAACASSMAAIQTSVKSLQDGDSDLVVTGGADRSMNIATYVKFSKIGALSADHSAPFDQSASGFVMGEGCGILVLKRYEDAVRDGDRVYAVVRGVGASSDGKGKGITAPNIQGQRRSLARAYAEAGIEPWEVDLIEAHGTSTVVGDKVEVEALSEFIGGGHRGDRGPVRIGSVKSMIGHLKSAAGAASVIKAALALHHGVLPPSLNFRHARSDVPLDTVPLRVQTVAEPWPQTPDGLRRAGVSAFGFGGTNFHVVLESFAGQNLPSSVPKTHTDVQPAPLRRVSAPRIEAGSERPGPTAPGLPEGVWAVSGLDTHEVLAHLNALLDGRHASYQPSAPIRLAAAFRDGAEREDQLKRAVKSLEKGSNPDLLRARSIAYEDGPFDGKLAFLFTGQGSQYLDMGLDLAQAYPIVADTYAEADQVLIPTLGKGITEYIRLGPGEDKAAKSDLLRQTEYSQPATLTLDIAILRLLAAYGVVPDLVAGHSLGEYGAAVAAGVMTFEQSLLAVSARGREMASIRLDDPGKMAGIATGSKAVQEILAEVDGYVIAANKNCPTQTVIAGASDAVDEASERFKAAGITVYPLPVSHAFHSNIVAPASEPLRGVLTKLGLNPPRRPITTNVTGDYYPTGEGAVEQIIGLLAQQISGPVEWTSQMERMYEDGARVFVECGPKRALSGFTVSILKRRPHRALYTNHPKRGGVASFRDSLASLVALGLPVRAEPARAVDLFAEPAPRGATTQAITAFTELHPTQTEAAPDLKDGVLRIVAKTTGYQPEELDLDYELEADLGIDTVKQAEVFSVVRSTYGIAADPGFSFADHRTLRSLIGWAADRTGATRISVGSHAADPEPTSRRSVPAPSADDHVSRFLEHAARVGIDGVDAESFARTLLPSVQGLLDAAFEAARAAPRAPVVEAPPPALSPPSVAPAPVTRRLPGQPYDIDVDVRIVCTGAAIGLPGGEQVFGPDNFARILSGEGRISHIGERTRAFLDKGLTRLVKDPQTGQGSFLEVTSEDEVIRLAGTRASFDLTEWGIDPRLVAAFDGSTQLAIAAGLEALRDAGIPLVRTYKTTTSGKRVPRGWGLPEALRDGTGVIFGSAFPGLDQLVRHVESGGRDAEGRFDRFFLFQILTMGHSQFAQLIGARGPNTALNGACASSTQGLALAEDWIRLGRCERVIVVGADDVTTETLLPWIGGGFMAAGAATTHDVVEEAALPFDARRHGLILGMGAVGMVVESAPAAERRGVVPLAEQLGTSMVNSAFHGTRLDVEHIAGVMRSLVHDVCEREGITPQQFARQAIFMSHETYTPARGGSAAAEIEALREAFGAGASEIVVANTKGFTGHPMGAGIEDGVVLKALQYGVVPPVANLKVPDEQLGDLTLSTGQRGDFRYAVRLAAGFGSQLALSIHKAVARGDHRVADADRRLRWLREITGYPHVEERIEDRTLRAVEADTDQAYDLRPDVSPIDFMGLAARPAPSLPPSASPGPPPAVPASSGPAAAAGAPPPSSSVVLSELIGVIAVRTGYEPAEIEPDFELEADLGIDTVKQAEILGELTDRYGIQNDEGFRLADYPTIQALAGYLASASAGGGAAPAHVVTPGSASPAPPAPVPPPPAGPPPAAVPPPHAAAPAASSTGPFDVDASLKDLLQVVSDKTGYETDELDPDFELEADLGIDTVKQAEILGELTERYGIEQDETFRLSDYPTLEKLAGYLAERRVSPHGASPATAAAGAGAAASPPAATGAAPAATPPASVPSPSEGRNPEVAAADGATLTLLLQVVADKTGYDLDDLDPTFELEADLGVDTVKQAEILSALTEAFGLQPDEDFRPADYPSLEDLVGYLERRRGSPLDPAASSTSEPRVAAVPAVAEVPVDEGTPRHVALPATFRIRRTDLLARPLPGDVPSLAGEEIQILGSGPLADAVQGEITRRGGALTSSRPSAVIDLTNDVMASFSMARALDAAGRRPARWLTVTRIGGLTGDGDLRVPFVDGARAGFTKSLGREWPETTAKVLDVHPARTQDESASRICDELVAGADGEVFIDAEGSRAILRLVVQPAPAPGYGIDAKVVVLTGGGRGITARIAEELARRTRGHGLRVALVGRSSVPANELDEGAAKAEIKQRLQAAGGRVTPAKVDAELAPLRKGEEVRQTLERLRALGADARYYPADLASDAGTRELVATITKDLGPVDLLVHGAGVEESRLIGEKGEDAFHRVFDGKAVGGRALLESVPVSARVVSMGSVAGRFGNPGQVDYAAANDALARMCHARPNSLHVDWTAWDDVGMAVRGGMRSLLEGRGVDLLPADAGACLLADLIGAAANGEIVVAGALGDFEPGPDHPLLDTLEVDGNVARGSRVLSLARDGWIEDHAIEGTPVLPGVVGIELMTAVASALFEGQVHTGATDVAFEAPAKVYRDEPTTLQIEATRIAPGRARASLVSTRTLRTGRVQRTEHFAATLVFGDVPAVEALPTAFLPDEPVDRVGIYRRFFHGPRFQVLTGVVGVSADGLLAEGEGLILTDGLLTDALVVEAAFQAAGLHRMIVSHQMGLPQRIRALQVIGRAPAGASLSVVVRQVGDVYDIDIDSVSGPILRMRGYAMIDRGPVPPPERFPVPDRDRPISFPTPRGGGKGSGGGPVIAEARADEDPAAWLTDDELTQLHARGTERRVRDRVAGRVAAKRALATLTGVAPLEIRVGTADSGEPIAVVPGHDSVRVSLSHRDGRAVAVAVDAGHVGIDLERIERRDEGFSRNWFDAEERALTRGDAERETVAWAIKEAVLKLVGTGMACSPHDVRVRRIGEGTADIEVVGEVRDHLDARGGGPLRVAWATVGVDEVVVTVRTAA